MASSPAIESLRQQIVSCEAQLQDLRQQLATAERSYAQNRDQDSPPLSEEGKTQSLFTQQTGKDPQHVLPSDVVPVPALLKDEILTPRRWPLLNSEYQRYGRQLIMPEIGLQGQLHLKNASVLIVGVGGLGCPAAAYLVGAGVGTVGLVDGDTVEESNLHRQILHSTPRVGMTKVESAMVTLKALNPNVKLVPHICRLTPETALSTFQPYDLVLDCTDTPASRYLISDTCVLLGKTLVSASALRTDGQLMVLNNPPRPAGDTNGGPCYRCVFPKPPPPESVVSCGDGGILGPVVGLMGILQALEAIKVLTRGVVTPSTAPSEPPTLLLFSAYATPMFRSIRLRTRKPKCAACSAQASVTPQALNSGSLDYVQFCGSIDPVNALGPEKRVSAKVFAEVTSKTNPANTILPSTTANHILIDVREKVQFDLCNLDGSVNIPFSTVSSTRNVDGDKVTEEQKWVSELRRQPDKPIYVVCRLGNDSQITVKKMEELGLDNGGERWIGDIRGGLRAWRENVDIDFPDY